MICTRLCYYYKLDQGISHEKVSTTIIKHNYPFIFVEHEGIRDLHSFLNPVVISITRNPTKADVLNVYKREKEKLKHALESVPNRICFDFRFRYVTISTHYAD